MTLVATAQPARPLRTISYQKIVNVMFWLCVASGSVVFIEPAPYDFLIIPTMLIWFIGGVRIHKSIIPYLFLMVMWTLGGYLSLIPYWHETDPKLYMSYSLILTIGGIFYALFFSENTTQRINVCLNAFACSAVLAAVLSLGTWWLMGQSDDQYFIKDGRAMFPFKDPNVLGTYLVLAIVYLTQLLLLGRTKHILLVLVSLLLILGSLFASFSRGSWGAAIIANFMMIGFSFIKAETPALRKRITLYAAIVVGAAIIGLLALLSNDTIREFFLQRAAVTQDYDVGETGRFGNQLRSIPMLLDLPNGMGPLRYRLIFDLEPHSGFINSFASMGWLGGFTYIALFFLTLFIGFRLALSRSPYMEQAHVIWPAMFGFLLQSIQIDVDHWRFFHLVLAALWGLEVARQKWLESQAREKARAL